MAEDKEARRDRLVDQLNSGNEVSRDDLSFLAEQTSIAQRLFSGFGFIGTLYDELSETGQQTLAQSGEGEPGAIPSLLSLGVPDELTNLSIGIANPTFGGGLFGRATVGRDAFLRDVMNQRTPLSQGIRQAILRNKGKIIGGTAIGLGGFALAQGALPPEEGRGAGRVGGEKEEEDQGAGISPEIGTEGQAFYIDPATGEVVPITLDPGIGDSFGVGPSGTTPNFSPELVALAGQFGIDASGLQTGILQESFLTGINEFGEGRVSPTERPFGVTPRGEPIGSAKEFQSRRGRDLTDVPSGFGARFKEEFIAGGIAAPPGARLNRRIFEERDGKTLLERAGFFASTYGVPLDILYGTVNALSGWNDQAVGNSGTTFGLAQIPSDVVSPENAIRSQFSLNYLAKKLRSNFGEYGNWEMAALAYRSPEAANRFLTSGTLDKTDKAFLTDVLGGSAASGLGNNIFDFAGLAATPERRGGGGGGPRIPPFQAPDPAELREFSRSAFSSVLGRDPTDDELTTGVEELTKGFRLAYDAQVKQIRGQASVDVDPQARFLEQLEGSGEAQFREEVVTQRSVFDQMGDWARVLREI